MLRDVLGHHRDAGVEQVGQREVVEADQGDAAQPPAPAVAADGTGGEQVLRREDRRRAGPAGRAARARARGGAVALHARAGPGRVGGRPARSSASRKPAAAAARSRASVRSASSAMRRCPCGEQVRDGQGGRRDVVDDDAVDQSRGVGPVDEDDRPAQLLLVQQRAVVAAGRHGDDAVDLAARRRPAALPLPGRRRGRCCRRGRGCRARGPRPPRRAAAPSRTGWRRRRAAGRRGRPAVAAAQAAGRQVVPVAQQHHAACCTRSARAGDTPPSRFTTRDTVFKLTPASAATSRIVARASPAGLPGPVAAVRGGVEDRCSLADRPRPS